MITAQPRLGHDATEGQPPQHSMQPRKKTIAPLPWLCLQKNRESGAMKAIHVCNTTTVHLPPPTGRSRR